VQCRQWSQPAGARPVDPVNEDHPSGPTAGNQPCGHWSERVGECDRADRDVQRGLRIAGPHVGIDPDLGVGSQVAGECRQPTGDGGAGARDHVAYHRMAGWPVETVDTDPRACVRAGQDHLARAHGDRLDVVPDEVVMRIDQHRREHPARDDDQDDQQGDEGAGADLKASPTVRVSARLTTCEQHTRPTRGGQPATPMSPRSAPKTASRARACLVSFTAKLIRGSRPSPCPMHGI
jgi:hypothetical protein